MADLPVLEENTRLASAPIVSLPPLPSVVFVPIEVVEPIVILGAWDPVWIVWESVREDPLLRDLDSSSNSTSIRLLT